jgi:hypothetical protein
MMITKIRPLFLFDFVQFVLLAVMLSNYLCINLNAVSNNFLLFNRFVIVFLLTICLLLKSSISKHEISILLFLVSGQILSGFANPIGINLLFIMMFVISVKKPGIEKVSRYSLLCLAVAIIFLVAGVNLGLIENRTEIVGAVEGSGSTSNRVRSTFGMHESNSFSALVTAFIFILLFTYRKNRVKIFFPCAFLVYYFYLETDSRTMLLSIGLFFMFYQFYNFVSRWRSLFTVSILFIILLPVALTIMSGWVVSNFPILDLILSFRLTYAGNLVDAMTFRNWLIGGQTLVSNNTVDNSFALIISASGLPFLTYLIFMVYKRLKVCFQNRDPDTFCFILAFWSYSYSESNMLRPEALIGLIFWLLILGHVEQLDVTARN